MAAQIFNVLKYIPASTAAKALGKVDSRFKNYFANVAAYGLDVNRAVDFLSDQFEGESEEERLKKQQSLTAEEALSLQNMQSNKAMPRALKTAASFAIGGLLANAPEEQTQEQISPQELAQKVNRAASPVTQAYKAQEGLATPVIAGRAIAEAQQAPQRLRAALKAKNSPQTALEALGSTKTLATSFDLFKKDNPEIGRFMEAEIAKGKSHYQAAAKARENKKLKTPIMKLEDKMGQPFEDVVAQVFGSGMPTQQSGITPIYPVTQSQIPSEQQALNAKIDRYLNSKGAR